MTTLKDAALAAYREVTSRAVYGAQRQDLIEEALGILQHRHDNGEISIDVPKALTAALKEADESDGRATDGMIRRLREGVDPLEMVGDPALQMVVTLGKGFRKSWEYVTVQDLADMDLVRRTNLRATQEAYDEWRDNLTVVIPLVEAHGTVGAAVRAGAFTSTLEVAA